MTTKRLLAHTTPEATEYIQKIVNSKNQADYQKLKKLFDNHKFVTNNFDDTELNIATFDWQNLERDRNWWWQLQALPFLNWYANSLALQSEEERSRYFALCLDAIHNWISQARQNKESPLAWHDHAAAFRLRNLTNWLVFCHSTGFSVSEEPCAEMLGSLVIEHLDWLQEDNHYSKHTNHGFDQAMIALTIASMFASDDFEAYRHRNRERLKDEVAFAFTDEGVHKENSPGYQKMMLGRLKQLRTLAPLGEHDVSQVGERYIDKAEAFLRAITLPNGYLPMIGDTQSGDEGLGSDVILGKGFRVFDYSRSGYVVVKGVTTSGSVFCLILKCCHDSNYHRHDDDLMIYLWVNGAVVLGDGGLLSHNEKDSKRIFVRSPYAHSVPLLKSSAVRNKSKLKRLPSIEVKNGSTISLHSYIWGERVERMISLERVEKGEIKVFDKFLDYNASKLLKNNYFIPGGFEINYSGNKVDIKKGESVSVSLLVQDNLYVCFCNGWSGSVDCSAIISEKYGSYSDAFRVVIGESNSIMTKILID